MLPTANVHPLVRVGAAAHFMLYNKHWHRTEHYPSKCTCMIDPMHAVTIKPSVDDSWKYVSDDYWAPCISKLVKQYEHQAPEFPFGVGDRVELDEQAALLYEQGSSAQWYVEAFTKGNVNDSEAKVVRLRDKTTSVYVVAPVDWVKPWVPAEQKEEQMADMLSTDPFTAKIRFKPTEDRELRCVFCDRNECTHEFASRAMGRRSEVGVHGACVRTIIGVEIEEQR